MASGEWRALNCLHVAAGHRALALFHFNLYPLPFNLHPLPFTLYPSPFTLSGLVLTAFCLLSPACGYHVAGRGDHLPADVKTIAVPIFTNQSSRFRIEQRLAQAVTREFIERTRFRITPDPAQADAVLKGTVKDVRAGYPGAHVLNRSASALRDGTPCQSA